MRVSSSAADITGASRNVLDDVWEAGKWLVETLASLAL
jgi:hypothetical protein